MKKKSIKKIAGLVALVMAASAALAGCGNTAQETVQSQETQESQESQVSQEVVTSQVTREPEKTGSITVMTYFNDGLTAEEGEPNDNRWTRWISENSPVSEVNWVAVPKSEAPEIMKLNFAAGESPDLLPNYEAPVQFYQNGMCMEITDEMLDKMPNYKRLLELHPILEKTATVDGKRMYFTKFSLISANHRIVIRKDWLENLGLDLPETVDDLYDIIYAFTYNDPDGNGVDDTWGISLTSDTQRVLSHMFGFGNPCKYAFNEDGELVYAWDRIESWLTFVKKLVDNKLVNPDFVTMTGDDDQADFLSGRIGIWGNGRFGKTLYKSFKENFPAGSVDTFALPETEYGKYSTYLSGGGSYVGYISADTDQLDAVLAFANWLYDPEVSRYLTYGAEGDYYEMNDEGTYVVIDADRQKKEMGYNQHYHILYNELFEGDDTANVNMYANTGYNQDLVSEDPIVREWGAVSYKMTAIANEAGVEDPRKWQNDGLPSLPDELAVILATADGGVNQILQAAIADSSITAKEAIDDAKLAWYGAGGEQIDEYYAEYYRTKGNAALLPSDFVNAKSTPQLTPTAQANYDEIVK